jgi:hypothetical protein
MKIAALFLYGVLLAIPFDQLYQLEFPIGILNAAECQMCLLIGLSGLRMVLRTRNRTGLLLLLSFLLLLVVHLVLALFIFKRDRADVFLQIRYYLPFVTALSILAADWAFSMKQVVLATIYGITISSIFVLFIPIIDSASINAYLEGVLPQSFGRIIYVHGLAVLFLLALLRWLLTTDFSTRDRVLAILAIGTCSIVVVLVSQSRTTFLGIMFIIGCEMFAIFRKPNNAIALIAVLGIVGASGLYLGERITETHGEMAQVFRNRIGLGSEGADYIYVKDLENSRLPAYEEYAQQFKQSYGMGVGLGVALSEVPGEERIGYTTDVSVLTMGLVFGVPGIVVLVLLLRAIWKRLSTLRLHSPLRGKVYLRTWFWTLIILSLNIDLFVRNSCVILLTMVCCVDAAKRSNVRSRKPIITLEHESEPEVIFHSRSTT